jgi:hypothetical protein
LLQGDGSHVEQPGSFVAAGEWMQFNSEPLLGGSARFLGSVAAHRYALATARLVLCERFLYEFYDKIARFHFWSDSVANNGFGSSSPYLISFIILLLIIGVPSVVAAPFLAPLSKWRRRFILLGFFCLLLFQLPTTILFENGPYEISSSVSIIGGLMLATCTSL